MPEPIPAWEPGRAYLHFERLPPAATHYLVRAWNPYQWSAPPAFDRATGQPWIPYDGTAVISTFSDIAEVRGILRVPELTFWQFRDRIRRELGVQTIHAERWDWARQKKRQVILNFPAPPSLDQIKTGIAPCKSVPV